MVQTAREALLARFDEMKGRGLRDMKFFLEGAAEVTVEAVCAEVNKFYDEVHKGNFKRIPEFKDSNRTPNVP
jgi:hypothetical protein